MIFIMFPGLGNFDPKKMNQMLKQFGIKTEEINAEKVIIIELEGKKVVIEKPNITKMKMQGQTIYTITGKEIEEKSEIPEHDIKLVSEQAKVSKEEAKKALEETKGDIAEAIQKLMEKTNK